MTPSDALTLEQRYELELTAGLLAGSKVGDAIAAALSLIDSLTLRLGEVERERDAAILRAVDAELLVNHAWVHSSYRNCGYDQMGSDERVLFDAITAKELEDLYAEKASLAQGERA
jgi:hypothetical protein